MKTKLDTLKAEQGELSARITELEAQQSQKRAEMVADPLRRAHVLAPDVAQMGVQIEVFREKLAQVSAQVKAEEARLNSPEVKAQIKKAEKMIAENDETRNRILAQLTAILSEAEAAITKGNEAAQLLKNGGRDNANATGGAVATITDVWNLLSGWVSATSQRDAFTAQMKQAQAAKAERDAAREKADAQAREDAKKLKPLAGGFLQAKR